VDSSNGSFSDGAGGARSDGGLLPACSSATGTVGAYYACRTQADCQPGLYCVGDPAVASSYYCKPSCRTAADCATYAARFAGVTCMTNWCSDGTAPISVCNDHPTDVPICCAAGGEDGGNYADVIAGTANGHYFSGGAGRVAVTQGGFTLIFVSDDPKLLATTADNIIRASLLALIAESARFNPDCPRYVWVAVDPNYTAAGAVTTGAAVQVNATYIDAHVEDYDVLTHEMMHVVQQYGYANGPAYWVEGLADYARYRYGINNAAAGWSPPPYASTQKYTDSYQVTARFLVWLENHVSRGIPTDLDRVLRAATYSDTFWVAETGRTVDQLWSAYGANPAL
jgi:hypothetical protein